MNKLYSVSDDEFIKIVDKSNSISGILLQLGYANNSYSASNKVKERISSLGLELPRYSKESPLLDSELFRKNSVHKKVIRERLIKENIIPYSCCVCGNTGTWNNETLSLQLHHIDGDNTNNEIENLCWMCPNCHTQTDNYGSKNKKDSKKSSTCKVCGSTINTGNKYCSRECYYADRKNTPPVSKKKLSSLITKYGFSKTGRILGVSDNGVRVWCKKYEMSLKIKDYK